MEKGASRPLFLSIYSIYRLFTQNLPWVVVLSGTNASARTRMTANPATWNDESKTLLTVKREIGGWEVQEVRDSQVIRQVHMSDWHRVERVLRLGQLPTADPALAT